MLRRPQSIAKHNLRVIINNILLCCEKAKKPRNIGDGSKLYFVLTMIIVNVDQTKATKGPLVVSSDAGGLIFNT